MMNGHPLSPPRRRVEVFNMNILFVLIDDKLDAHYIISEDVNNKEEPNE